LSSFSSSLPTAVDVLAGLQVQHLTCVQLTFIRAMTDSSALSMALAQLSNLQQLRIGNMDDASLGTALTTLVQLPRLTLLDCDGQWSSQGRGRQSKVLASPLSEALQQLLAQPLPLKSLQLPGSRSYRLPALNMPLLTKLTELSIGRGALVESTVLPARLQRLKIYSAASHSMAPLTRLELK
jgi:hypothetical protein